MLNGAKKWIGNGAAGQVQLDVLGEVIDALFQANLRGLGPSPIGWALAREIMEHLEEAWRKPDHGIWEVRGPARHFTHSKVMAWVAFDRGIRAHRRGVSSRLAHQSDDVPGPIFCKSTL